MHSIVKIKLAYAACLVFVCGCASQIDLHEISATPQSTGNASALPLGATNIVAEKYMEALGNGRQDTPGADNDIYSQNGRFGLFELRSIMYVRGDSSGVVLSVVFTSEELKGDKTRIVAYNTVEFYTPPPGYWVVKVDAPQNLTVQNFTNKKLHGMQKARSPFHYWYNAELCIDTEKKDDRPYIGWKGAAKAIVTIAPGPAPLQLPATSTNRLSLR